jgi:proline iminopeptidase
VAGELIDVGGTRIFVDIQGAESAPPLLFIHGGPGQGCYDFMQAQGSRLARSLRVIGVDQRGALRSDPLLAEHALTMALLVSDYEDLRRQLGLTDWAILGHSFGGGVALAYASSQPRSVSRTIFDCPCWDGDLSDRSKLDVAAGRLAALGRDAAAGRCRQLAAKPDRLGPADDVYGATLALDEHYMELFFHRAESAAEFHQLLEGSGLTEEQWDRGRSHASLLADLYPSQLPLLAGLTQPALLLHGADGLTTPPEAIAAFRAAVPGGLIRTFGRSAHFAYLEEPDDYAAAVTGFMTKPPAR